MRLKSASEKQKENLGCEPAVTVLSSFIQGLPVICWYKEESTADITIRPLGFVHKAYLSHYPHPLKR